MEKIKLLFKDYAEQAPKHPQIVSDMKDKFIKFGVAFMVIAIFTDLFFAFLTHHPYNPSSILLVVVIFACSPILFRSSVLSKIKEKHTDQNPPE